jgi:uncharacterized protein YjbJ (UPF0337 family)
MVVASVETSPPADYDDVRIFVACKRAIVRQRIFLSGEPREGFADYFLKSGSQGGKFMDWNRVEGNWKQAKGKIKEQWGKLTDDDLDVINGQRDQLEGKIQERYGYARDQVRRDVDDWYNSQNW